MFSTRHPHSCTFFSTFTKSKSICLSLLLFSFFSHAIQNKAAQKQVSQNHIELQNMVELKVFGHTKNHPFVYKDNNATWQGIEIDIISELVRRAGFTYKMIDNLDWNQAYTALRRGEIDMMPTLSYTLERKKDIHYLGISGYEYVVLITLKDTNITITTLDDFLQSKYSFGLVNNVLYSDNFNNRLNNDKKFKEKFYFANALSTRVKLLKNKRIVGFLYRKHAALENFKDNKNFKGLKLVELQVFKPEPIYLGIRNTLPLHVIQKLQQTYRQLIKEGIIANHFYKRFNIESK